MFGRNPSQLPRMGIGPGERRLLTPNHNAVEYFCDEGSGNVLTDTLGNGGNISLTGTTAFHLSDLHGMFTGSDGSASGDRYGVINDDAYIDAILRSDNFTGQETIIIAIAFLYSAHPTTGEYLLSWGHASTGYYELFNIASGSGGGIQFNFNDGTTAYNFSFGGGKFTADVINTVVIQLRAETETYDFYINDNYTQNNGLKSNYIGSGVAPSAARGLCIGSSYITGTPKVVFGSSLIRTARLADVMLVRSDDFLNGAAVAQEYYSQHGRQLVSLR